MAVEDHQRVRLIAIFEPAMLTIVNVHKLGQSSRLRYLKFGYEFLLVDAEILFQFPCTLIRLKLPI